MKLTCKINGQKHQIETYPMTRLLDVLREEAHLTGTKEGCGEGECGACSVLMDGELVNSCLIPACQAENTEIKTIEGLMQNEEIHEIQQAFLQFGGAQCGICTPGMIMAVQNLLKNNPEPSNEEIREGLAGNICRCTGYIKIFETIQNLLHNRKTTLGSST